MGKSAADIKKEQESIKQELEQIRQEKEAEAYGELVAQRQKNTAIFYENVNAKAEPHWAEVDKYLKNSLIFTGQESFKDYSTSMMNFFGSLVSLHKALVADQAAFRVLSWISSRQIGSLSIDALSETGKAILDKLSTSVANKLLKQLNGVTPTPPTRYDIEIDDNGKLKTQVIIQGKLLSAERQAVFDKGFEAWLDQVNFLNKTDWTIDTATNTIKDGNGVAMQMKDLDALNTDPKTSLVSFFSGTFDFKITPAIQRIIDDAPDPSSSPKP